MRPSPMRSQASRPDEGSNLMTLGKLSRYAQLRFTAWLFHMPVFIAAAAITGTSEANRTLEEMKEGKLIGLVALTHD